MAAEFQVDLNFLTDRLKLIKLIFMSRLLQKLLFLSFILVTVLQNASFAQDKERVDFLQLQNLTGARGGNLVVAISSDPSNFNRMLTSGLANAAVAERLSTDLVHINRSNLSLESSLAARWEADKTGRVYTIHLRHGIRFSNNTAFTADDVVFTWQVLTDPNVPSAMAGQVETDGTFPTMTKIDNYTVRLTFRRPVGMGLRMLDSVPILPKSQLLKAYREGRLATVWGPNVNPADVVGLGPFRLKEYERGIRIVLERNPYFWKKDRSGQILPYLDSITYLIVPDLNAEALRFGQGELDMIDSLNPENYATLRRAANQYTIRDLGPGLMMDFLWFNLNGGRNSSKRALIDPEKAAIFEKAEFRRGVSYALDRKGMARAVLMGLGVPQYGPVSSGNKEWYDAGIPRTEYNPAYARELLAKAGLRDWNGDGILEYGSKRLPFELSLFTSRGNSAREKLAEVIQDNLSKVGIRISIQHLLPNEVASRFLDSFEYEAILFGFTPTDVAPDLQTDLWYSSGNIHFWCPNQEKPGRPWEATMDSLISTLVKSIDPAVRKSVFDQVQELWATQMPAIPTVAPDILVGWSNKLGNVRPSIMTPHLLWNAEELCKRAGTGSASR
jgi:peptide/nickel transport system substrate-binding protein